jgi:hypothetical protein
MAEAWPSDLSHIPPPPVLVKRGSMQYVSRSLTLGSLPYPYQPLPHSPGEEGISALWLVETSPRIPPIPHVPFLMKSVSVRSMLAEAMALGSLLS